MSGLRAQLGEAGVKLSSSGILYGFRHGYATDLLEKKVPEAHVAALMGHKSTAMLSKHYSHLGSKPQALKAHLGHITTMPCEAQVGGGDTQPAVPAKDENPPEGAGAA
jgi:Phage integrase family